jgi:hypothetical protein
MTDALLLSRIESLDENLRRVDESLTRLRTWQNKLERGGTAQDRVADDLWHKIDFVVRREFSNERKQLDQLRKSVERGNGTEPDAQAWTTYAAVRDESERLFDECLEFIGAIAFRHTGLDEQRMCQLADALILACALEAYAQNWTFLTVPSLRDVVTKSQLRLSRIRFPEWTFWTLPATAYVLGHEVMTEQPVAELVEGRMASWAREDVARRHVPVLIAEAFAAFLMGPAYGHAAIRLRFDPSRAYDEDPQRPAEASRAYVVLKTLSTMSAYKERAWEVQVTRLLDQWDGAVAAAAPKGAPPDAAASLDELVSEAVDHFAIMLNINAQYGPPAWRLAERLYERWREEAEASEALDALTSEPPESFVTARDVLNAAWLMRVARPQDVRRIEAAATNMCRRVLATPEAGGAQGQEPIPTTT